MAYIHGTQADEQVRLAALNRLINPPFLEFLRLDGASSILEVGSGLALLTREVALRCPRAEVVGVEFSQAQLLAAGTDLPPNLRLVQGDAHELGFADGSFDVVYCRFLLEHVQRPDQVAHELQRVLKPGGRVYVQENDILLQRYDPSAPLFEHVWSKVAQLQRALGGDALIGVTLFRLLTEAGFHDVSLSLAPEVYWSGTPGLGLWIDNEIAILRGCQDDLLAHHLVTRLELDGAVAELTALRNRNDTSAWFYWNRAAARK